MEIRNATIEDLKAISEIEATCWGTSGASLGDFQGFFSNKSANDFLQIVEDERTIQGYIGFSLQTKDKSINIWNVAVSPQFRRTGHATRLITQAFYVARSLKANNITLKVSETNTGATELYRKLGFVQNSRMENYYPDGSAVLILCLPA